MENLEQAVIEQLGYDANTEPMNEYKSIGFDQNGIPRVFGYGETILEANTNCLLAAFEISQEDLELDYIRVSLIKGIL